MKLVKHSSKPENCKFAVLHEPSTSPVVYVSKYSSEGPVWKEMKGLSTMPETVIDKHEHFHYCTRMPHIEGLDFQFWIMQDEIEKQPYISAALEALGVKFVANYFPDYYSFAETIRKLGKISRKTGETVDTNKLPGAYDIALLDLFVPYGTFHAQEPAGWGLEAAHLLKEELPHNNIFTKVVTEYNHHDIEFLHHIRGSLGVEWYDSVKTDSVAGWLYILTTLLLEWEDKHAKLDLPLLIV